MIEVKIDNLEAIQSAFRRLASKTESLKPALDKIGEHLVETTKQRFGASVSPDGRRWKANKPSTLAGKTNPLPLVRHGDLQDEVHYRAGNDRVEIGSPMIYAATQQFGAKRHSFGKGAPWGDIPARPFLGVSRDDSANILDILTQHLQDSLK